MDDEIAVEKLRSEIDKLRAKAETLRRAPHAIWTNWIPLLGGLAALVTALIGGVIQWRVTDWTIKENQVAAAREVLNAERKVLEAEKKTDTFERQAAELAARSVSLDAEISAKTALLARAEQDLRARQEQFARAATTTQDPAARQTLNAAAAEAGAAANEIARRNKVVYIQFRGDIDRAKVDALRAKIQDVGYFVPGAERIMRDYTSNVRYFNRDDDAIARDVGGIASTFLKESCGLTSPLPVDLVQINRPARHVEVWINVKCST